MNTKICESCKKEKATKDFYFRQEPNDNHLEPIALPYCKRCITKFLNDYFVKFKDFKKAMYYTCALLDIPFVEQIFNKALGNNETITFSIYYNFLWGNKSDETNIQYKDFSDSQVNWSADTTDMSESDKKAIENLVLTWGEQDTVLDYKFLENTFKRYTKGMTIESSTQVDLIRDLCLARLEKRKIDTNRIDGDSNKVLTKILTLLNKLNLDNFEQTKDETLSDRFITKRINDVEQHTVCEVYKDPHKYYDMNCIRTYNKLFSKRPLMNSILGSRDFDVDLDDLDKYKIEVPYSLTEQQLYGLTDEEYKILMKKERKQ